MLNELLWLATAKQQHDIQKSTGLSGIFAIGLVIFIVWQWNNVFLPIIQFLKLDEFANRMGIVTDTPIHTIINSLYLGLIILAIVVVILVLPTFIALFFATAANINFLAIPLSYVIFFALSPIIFCIIIYKKLNERFYLSKKESPETLKQHYLRDSLRRLEYKEVEHLPTQLRLHTLFTSKNTQEDVEMQSSPFTYDTAVTYLNRAVASIETERNWLIGYHSEQDQWYTLFPNPLPVYASPAFKGVAPTGNWTYSTFRYKELRSVYEDYLYSIKSEHDPIFSKSTSKKPSFHVPAYKIKYNWNGFDIQLDITENQAVHSVNIEELTLIECYKGNAFTTLFERIAEQPMVLESIKTAHLRAYLIPIAFPDEIKYLTYTNGILCYVHELNDVPYAREYSAIYSADVQKLATKYARMGCQWAKDYIDT